MLDHLFSPISINGMILKNRIIADPTGDVFEEKALGGAALVIAGHAYEPHFWPLHYLSVGDEVFLTDMGGNRLRYSVSEIQTLEDTAIGDMVNSGYDLTLFTCTNNGIARLAVRCSRG